MTELTTREKIVFALYNRQKDNMPLQPNWHIIDGKWSHLFTEQGDGQYKTYQDGELIGEKPCPEIEEQLK